MKIFLIGIAGAGMHSLALYLHELGHIIAGSDPGASESTCSFWADRGVKIYTSQSAEHIHGYEMVIYSSAIPKSNPERKAAEDLGVACSRGQALARFANEHPMSIAVCGTHGKGTTSAAIVHMLRQLHVPVSDVLGATPIGREQPCHHDPDGKILVCEVDESDRTHVFHRPGILLINNVEADHLNQYKDLNDIVETFAQHVRLCLAHGTHVIIHHAGVGAPILYQSLRDCSDIDWVAEEGIIPNPSLGYQIEDPDGNGRCRITLREASGDIIRLLPLIGGRANAQNLASAIMVGRFLGISLADAARALTSYEGLKDRCEIQKIHDILLVTDYASHPTCVTNDIAWIRPQSKRVLAVYHPYRYTLMGCHWKALGIALSTADETFILPFDPCGETEIPGISSPSLADEIVQNNGHAQAFDTFEDCFKALSASVKPGDAVIVFAGGFIFDMARRGL